ncbi:hypothetical protein SAMN05660443_0683 [Marinospirillum celere]|uniref:Uncharacterized protein n=1 Tax=Marinospirillum celere TaxID=1122252 RepID=A0A1I1EL64_9GAMM|nr:tetratricopeptide repeat protein [Marinospirillum celere]SFB87874.1 hypothetical protein SAMN05660443_0683 [Marinospirillum celere]
MIKKLALPLALSLLATPVLASAPDWRNNQLLLPEKVTVGPSDNYQAQVDSEQQRLFFTRHQNLVSQPVQQNLETGRVRQLLPPDHDAKDPALSPNERQLALTSYRRNALGSVCLLPLFGEDRDLRCLTPDGERAWLPFWVNNTTLGYLRRAANRQEQELVFHSLDTNRVQVKARGRLSAPSVSADGRYLVYQRHEEASQGMYLVDLQTDESWGPLPLDLPGISSYAVINPDDGYLYFSHYLSDTSGDQQIDAEDHSVIFRIRLDRLLASDQALLPEQLTSVTYNCNFPSLGGDQLYVTCAYEGSLDTYRLPLTGQLPEHWGEKEIWQAHAVASRPAERLLLLNQLRFREGNSRHFLERLLANHLQMDELTAASYFAGQLQDKAAKKPEEAAFYANLQTLLQLKGQRQLQPRGQLSPAYRRSFREAAQNLDSGPDTPLFAAWIAFLGQQPGQARQELQAFQSSSLPLAEYLRIELSLALASSNTEHLEALLAAAGNSLVAPDARLFYAFQHLQLLSRTQSDVETHLQALAAASERLDDERLLALYANEKDLLRLGAATERSEERSLYQTISGRLREYRDEPKMHRASHIRAVQLMGLAEKYDFMELMSRHWLTTTDIRHVGFAASAEQYATINLNRGYGSWAQGQEMTALNTFYSVLRQTSDLEALHNLLALGLNPEADSGLQDRMQRLYDQLIAEELLGNNALYAEALRPLLYRDSPSKSRLEAAAEKLQQLEVSGLDSGVRDLLLGSIYHRLLLATQDGYSQDQDLAQRAHYHYMLGLDLAYRNPRVEAALLENLGQLHFQRNNPGLAVEFFSQRLQLPWLDAEQEIWLHWRLARAYYYSNRYPAAARHAQRAWELGQVQESAHLVPLQERAAFYALQAREYRQAEKLYTQLLEEEKLSGNNAIRAMSGRAYALFQLQETTAARQAYQELLDHLPQATPVAARNDRLARFEPRRLQVKAYGFKAQLAATPEEALEWLDRRLALLERMGSKDRRYSLDEPGRFTLIIQSHLQQAALQEERQEPEAAAAAMRRALSASRSYQEAGGPLGSQPVLQSLYNYLTLGAWYPEAFAQEPRNLERLYEATLDELHLEIFMPPVNHAQRLKLQLLKAFYQWRRAGDLPTSQLESQLAELEESEAWQGLALTRPDLQEELNQLAAGIRLRIARL